MTYKLTDNELFIINRFYVKEYDDLYNERVAEDFEQVLRYDHLITTDSNFKELVTRFCNFRKDFLSSDRECNAFMNVFDVIYGE